MLKDLQWFTHDARCESWGLFQRRSCDLGTLNEGLPDEDVYAIGILSGRPPDASSLSVSLRIPSADIAYYNNCFQDWTILLAIRTHMSRTVHKATEIIRQYDEPLLQVMNS